LKLTFASEQYKDKRVKIRPASLGEITSDPEAQIAKKGSEGSSLKILC
jgi:hypothetical protein